MCEQFNCLFESQIAGGYSSHHWMAIRLLGRNDETPSTVTQTTFGAVQTQLPFYSVRELIFMILVTDFGVCFLLTAARPILLLPVPVSTICFWVFVCVSKRVPKLRGTFTSDTIDCGVFISCNVI